MQSTPEVARCFWIRAHNNHLISKHVFQGLGKVDLINIHHKTQSTQNFSLKYPKYHSKPQKEVKHPLHYQISQGDLWKQFHCVRSVKNTPSNMRNGWAYWQRIFSLSFLKANNYWEFSPPWTHFSYMGQLQIILHFLTIGIYIVSCYYMPRHFTYEINKITQSNCLTAVWPCQLQNHR